MLLSALAAFVFTLLARGFITIFLWFGWRPFLESIAHQLWPVAFSGTSLGAFFLAVGIAEISVLAAKTEPVTAWVVDHFAGDMIKLLHGSMLQLKPVSITLDSRKFYIGFVQSVPSLDPSKAYVRLMPMLSGYRNQSDLRLEFTTHYRDALVNAGDKIKDFVIVIPLASIKSVNLYDQQVHDRFFAKRAV